MNQSTLTLTEAQQKFQIGQYVQKGVCIYIGFDIPWSGATIDKYYLVTFVEFEPHCYGWVIDGKLVAISDL